MTNTKYNMILKWFNENLALIKEKREWLSLMVWKPDYSIK